MSAHSEIMERFEEAERRSWRIERKLDALIHFLLASHTTGANCPVGCRPCAELVRESVEANLR